MVNLSFSVSWNLTVSGADAAKPPGFQCSGHGLGGACAGTFERGGKGCGRSHQAGGSWSSRGRYKKGTNKMFPILLEYIMQHHVASFEALEHCPLN